MDSKYGFTLIELFVTLLIASIVVMFAVPGFNKFIKDNRLTTQTNGIVGALNLTRTEAVTKNVTSTVCASTKATTCVAGTTVNCCDTTNWENGWIVFNDADGNGDVNSGDTIVRVHGGTPGGITIRLTGMEDNSNQYVQYKPTGFIFDNDTTNANDPDGTFKICDDRGTSKALAVNVSNTGVIRSAKDTDSNGVMNDSKGNNITCP